MNRLGHISLFLLSFAVITAQAADLTWNAASGNWNTSGNWSPVDVPNSADDTVTFNITGADGTNTVDTGNLTITAYTLNVTNHTTDLNGNVLTVNTFTETGFGAATNAALNFIGSTGSKLYIKDTVAIGVGAYADASVTLAANVALQIGVATNDRAVMRVGENIGASPTDNNSYLTAGKWFNAHISDLYVGHRNAGYTVGITYGNLDASAATNQGVLDISGNVEIGTDRQAAGDVTVSDSIDVKIGSAGTRGGRLWVSEGGHDGSTPSSSFITGTGRFDAYVTTLKVGAGALTDGILDASNCVAGVLDVSGDVEIGYIANGANWKSGIVILSDPIAVKIGSSGARANFLLGYGRDVTIATFIAGTNTFEAYLNTFAVGQSPGWGGGTTVLDLSNISSGRLDVAGDFIVGSGRMTDVDIDLSAGFITKIGDPSSRVIMAIGRDDRPKNISVTAAGGTFSAYLSSLLVGQNLVNVEDGTDCILDLSAVTNGTLNVDGDITIGNGPHGEGIVKLAAFTGTVNNLYVGDTDTGAKGLLQLDGSVINVTNSVVIDGPSVANKGHVDVIVSGIPSGLDLAAGTSLTINEGIIDITFKNPIGPHRIYWGLAWAGDHYTTLTNWYDTGKLTWDDSGITNGISGSIRVFVKDNVTYVGAPGPSGTVIVIR